VESSTDHHVKTVQSFCFRSLLGMCNWGFVSKATINHVPPDSNLGPKRREDNKDGPGFSSGCACRDLSVDRTGVSSRKGVRASLILQRRSPQV
jgi:hypothetical protein